MMMIINMMQSNPKYLLFKLNTIILDYLISLNIIGVIERKVAFGISHQFIIC